MLCGFDSLSRIRLWGIAESFHLLSKESCQEETCRCRKRSHVKLVRLCSGNSNPTERSERAHCPRPHPCPLFALMVEITCQAVSYVKQWGPCEMGRCVCASFVNTFTRHRVSKHGGRGTPEMSQYNALFLLMHYVINRIGMGRRAQTHRVWTINGAHCCFISTKRTQIFPRDKNKKVPVWFSPTAMKWIISRPGWG